MGAARYDYDFGLSFIREKEAKARELGEALANRGFRVFNYLEDRTHQAQSIGCNLKERLHATYRRCRYCVVLWSSDYDSNASTVLEREYFQGRRDSGDRDFLLPVSLDGTRPAWLRDIIVADFNNPNTTADALAMRAIPPTVVSHVQKLKGKALGNNVVWQEQLGVDLFALPIRVQPADREIRTCADLVALDIRRLALLGKPGCGKTTMVRRILATADKGGYIVPIELRREWIRAVIEHSSGRDPINEMWARVQSSLRLPSSSRLEDIESTGHLLFVLDGLDQLTAMRETMNVVQRLSDRVFPNSRFLVACREEEYRRLGAKFDFVEQVIEPLHWPGMQAFLKRTGGGERRAGLDIVAVFRNNTALRKICEESLFIFLMVIRLLRREGATIEHISTIYQKYLDRYLGDWEGVKSSGARRSSRRHLEDIAHRVAMKSTDMDDLYRRQLVGISGKAINSLIKHGLLELRHGKLSFFQHTFQEFLFASWLFRNRIYPVEFQSDTYLYYQGYRLSDLTLRFYKELTGFHRFEPT